MYTFYLMNVFPVAAWSQQAFFLRERNEKEEEEERKRERDRSREKKE